MFAALHELALCASENVSSSMNAFQQISDPKTRRCYSIFRIDPEVAKGGKAGSVPVTGTFVKTLQKYHMAFGQLPQPSFSENGGRSLSQETLPFLIAG